ncbi:MAG: hypothetical protein AAF639_22910 [Chloroflexota bacterium]
MKALQQVLISKGYTVYIPDEDDIDYDSLTDEQQVALKGQYIDAHLGYIKQSDAILVANFAKNGIDGYIGANTLMEIAFAYVLGKRLFVLNEVGEQGCRLEILGMQPVILNGDLTLLT